jgi:hypothetical protein
MVVVLSACGSTSSATPGPTASAALRPSPAGPKPSEGLTQTGWGIIWDTVPSDFPTFPGSTPAEETATGPASANLVVKSGNAKEIATFLQTRLEQAGFKTQGASGPLENGGYVLDMTGPEAGCEVQITIAPTGSLTTVTILYGEACPHS